MKTNECEMKNDMIPGATVMLKIFHWLSLACRFETSIGNALALSWSRVKVQESLLLRAAVKRTLADFGFLRICGERLDLEVRL